ncbi:DUF5672 family protein [Pedobacter aquatilis]|uniref:DUF5672 family protein n=1 Tax=Pedobacter aquatilis TaxID=351343 RepID=UPI00292CC01F|nr:DUF5672 family protein [Pedobacter aquatilis]
MQVTDTLAAVLIPIYKETLNETESISLNQCLKVLKQHKIIFFGPEDLNLDCYQRACVKHHINFEITFFEKKYFEGINGYNQLMLSSHFYKTFIKFKFILIYQLDAFVFKDELHYWCNKGYDFIGAPNRSHLNNPGEVQFLKNYSKILRILKIDKQISNVGNGGFSLRKTRSCYRLVKFLNNSVEKWLPNNEDGFFKYFGNILFPLFKLPGDEEAISFSIEIEASTTLAKLKKETPFGCHAYEKYEWETWKPLIEKYSYLP